MILGLQIIAIIFAFIMIYLALLNFKRSEIDKVELVSWMIVWIVTLLIVIFPDLLRSFAQRFFITRLFDLMVVGGFILVIAMVVRAYVSVRRIERKLEKFIRTEALRGIKGEKNKSRRS